jgi:uncharacterized membrane protein YraQ (UPF0718 family)
MIWTIAPLLLLVLILGGVARWRGPEVFEAGLKSGGGQLLQFLPILAAAFLVMGFMDALLPQETVRRWMSDAAGWRGIGIAWLAGALTPAGGIVGMPLAAGLYRSGAGLGVIVTYLTSLSLLSFLRVPLEVGFYGARLTASRLVVSLLLPPLAGLIAQVLSPYLRG